MAQPPAYTPVHTFVSDSATLANFPGQQLDVEFNDIKVTTDQIRTNLALVQRDDGALANGAVTFDSLSTSLQAAGLQSASAWVTATAYQIGNPVIANNSLYRCLVAHTAGVFATDLAAGKWVLVSSLVYSAGTNIVFAGSVISTSLTPTFTTVNGNTITPGTFTLTGAASKTLQFNNSLTLAGTDGTTLTFQGTDTYIGRATSDTLTNKTFDTGATGNSFSIAGSAVSSVTGTGSVAVLATSPTLVTPVIGAATATSVNKVTITAPATSATLTLIDGTVLTGPAASGTVMTLGNVETVTGVKTFGSAGAVGKLAVAGTTSGSTVLNASAVASGTLTLPAATDTLVGKATTDILTNKTFDSAGTGNSLQVGSVALSKGQYPGETTTGSATAGNVGEYIESVVLVGSATALSTGAAKTVTSISLTAGDWDVDGTIGFVTAATTSVTQISASISGSTNTNDATPGKQNTNFFAAVVPTAGTTFTSTVVPYRISLSGTTTVFLIAQATFTASTLTAFGIIRARRAR